MKEENNSPKVFTEIPLLLVVGQYRLVDKVKVVTLQSQVCNGG